MAKGKGGFIGQDGLNAPDSPTGVSGSAGDTEVDVSFTAPSDVGGSAITGYRVQSNDGIGASGSSSPITVTGLTNGTSYTFNVWAINAFGYSAPSDASGSVSPQYAPRALYKLGYTSSSYNTSVDHIIINTTGNATDFGDTTNNFSHLGACSSSTRALFGVGYNGSAPTNTILYTTIAATGTFADFGDATYADYGTNSLSNSTRGLFMGGYNGASTRNNIDYVTIASTGNGADFGDMSGNRYMPAACSSTTRGIICGGTTSSSYSTVQNSIDYVTIATTGNATDFGDLTLATGGAAAFSSNTRGIRASGWKTNGVPQNIIDYITIASTGNATDFGDTTTSRAHTSGTSNSTRGLIIGGGTGSGGNTLNNTISYVTIASTGNDADFGDITSADRAGAATSDSHGGL